MQVHYFKVEGFEGDYFSCERYGTMAPSSCARNYEEAPEASRKGRLAGCVGCRIGQMHASTGDAPLTLETLTGVAYRTVCVRCRRGGEDPRLIGRMRLIRDHTTCVSCYNREREVLQGKNAKGATPKKWRGLFFARIGSVVGGALTIEQLDHPVRDRLEMMLTILRRKQGTQAMAWTSSRSIIRMEPAA